MRALNNSLRTNPIVYFYAEIRGCKYRNSKLEFFCLLQQCVMVTQFKNCAYCSLTSGFQSALRGPTDARGT